MTADDITAIARKYALQNAVQFNGKANSKAVIGKVIAACKEKTDISPQDIIPIVNQVIKDVNALGVDKQQKELADLAPELLQKEKKPRDFTLPKLPFAEESQVITRFPPEPNGFLHIGHAKAAFIDEEYARMYDGKFILRFDDTNPANAHEHFYEAQKEDLEWLGIKWDDEYCTSNNVETHYHLAEQLINQGHAYLCVCSPETIKDGRYHAKFCACRDISPGETLDKWRSLVTGGEEGGILRLVGDMQSANTAMRDPTLFRVIEQEHPIQGTKYRMWPTYDFAGAVEDSLSGVTHPFRTKEYELRDPVYFRILTLLGLRKPHLMEFARLSINGMPVSKRKIKPLIQQGQVSGFDDPRLPTLRGLHRRGILPETIKQFVITQGISKMESIVSFGSIEAVNRKLLDPIAKRYFFVPNPMKLIVKDAPHHTVRLPLHPTEELGYRTLETSDVFFLPGDDLQTLNPGDTFRLKELYNVTLTETGNTLHGTYAGEELIQDSLKTQWVTPESIPLMIHIPGLLLKQDQRFDPNSMQTVQGLAEPSVQDLSEGDIIQFERFGFIRLEKQQGELQGIFTHK